MGLNVSDLKSDIIDAYQHGMDGGSAAEVAQYLAFAIVSYVSEAEIICLPGPILIPVVPTPVPSSVMGRKVKILSATAMAGAGPLQSQILASFNAMDQLSLMSTGIVTYASTLTTFASPSIGAVTGASVMAIPPVFAPVIAAGMSATGEDPVIDKTSDIMSKIIHASFMSTIFTGVCTAVDGGVGPVSGPFM